MGAEAVDADWSGLFLRETQWLVMELDTSQRPAAHFQAIAVTSIHVHTVWEGELTAPFVFHKFSWLQLFTPSTTPRPPSPPPLPHKHARSSTNFPGPCETVYSFGRGQLHTWWQTEMVVLAQVGRTGRGGGGGSARGGPGGRAHRPVLQGLLNLHIPVHLAQGRVQECPLM